MTMTCSDQRQDYDDSDPAEERDELACRHREAAVQAVSDDHAAAVTHALLAIEARLDELAVHLSRIGP